MLTQKRKKHCLSTPHNPIQLHLQNPFMKSLSEKPNIKFLRRLKETNESPEPWASKFSPQLSSQQPLLCMANDSVNQIFHCFFWEPNTSKQRQKEKQRIKEHTTKKKQDHNTNVSRTKTFSSEPITQCEKGEGGCG